jgi:hypothetical protein
MRNVRMKVPEHALDRLRAAGLLVSDPYIPNHAAWPDGVVVGKPEHVVGNRIPGHRTLWGLSGPFVDAPCPILHFDSGNGKWVVTVHTYIPGPGPGDFINEWDTTEEAVEDILDYLLGDPARMRVKQLASEEFLARFAEHDDEDEE